MPSEELINCSYALLLHLQRRWSAILEIKLPNKLSAYSQMALFNSILRIRKGGTERDPMDGSPGSYLRYDLLGGTRGGRPERRRGAVGMATADRAGPPRESRRPRRERRHGGAPLHHHRRQHRGRRAPAARLGLLHEAAHQRAGVGEREPVSEEAVEDAAERRRPGGRDLRRQLQEVHLQRQRAHLRRRAQIRRTHR